MLQARVSTSVIQCLSEPDVCYIAEPDWHTDPAQLALCGEGGVFLFRALFAIAAHPHSLPRRLADQAVHAFLALKPSPESYERMLSALETVVKRSAEAAPAAASEEAATSEADVRTAAAGAAAARSRRLADLAVNLFTECPNVEALLPRLLVLCHQGAMVPSQGPGPWARLCVEWVRVISLPKLVESQVVPLCAHLLGEKGTLSTAMTTRTAALGALRAALQLGSDVVVPQLMPVLLSQLEETSAELRATSAAEVRILHTPNGRLSTDPPLRLGEGGGEGGGGGGGGGDGGDDWESEVRAKLKKQKADAAAAAAKGAKGGGTKGGGSKQEAMRERQMEDEKLTRERLQQAVSK